MSRLSCMSLYCRNKNAQKVMVAALSNARLGEIRIGAG